MFAVIVTLVALLFCVVAVVLPLRFPEQLVAIFDRLWSRYALRVRESEFDGGGELSRPHLVRWFRLWGVSSAVAFGLLAIKFDGLVRDHPSAIAQTFGLAVLALASGGAVVLTFAAYSSFLPRAIGYENLARCGFRKLWVVDLVKPSRKLRNEITNRLRDTERVSLVDINGYKLLGKQGAPLFQALAAAPDVPAYVLLYKPKDGQLDPERRVTSVFGTLLTDMNLTAATFYRQLKATLESVESLNEERAPEAKIKVRFYTEKPTFQALIFDNSAMVFPWQPQRQNSLTVLEVERYSKDPSLYEAHRRHFACLWGSPIESAEPREPVRELRDEPEETPWKAKTRRRSFSVARLGATALRKTSA